MFIVITAVIVIDRCCELDSIHAIFPSHPSLITRNTFLVVFYRLKYQKYPAFFFLDHFYEDFSCMIKLFYICLHWYI